jgi:diguanylate cyclase (GGDEF)-like protein/PAS domain S-box-containing protein
MSFGRWGSHLHPVSHHSGGLTAGALIALLYWGLAHVVPDTALAVHRPPLFAPQAGLALAALLAFGRQLWPGVWLGALLAGADAGLSWPTAAGVATADTLESLLGAWLVQRFAGGADPLRTPAMAFAFVLWGVALAPLLGALLSAATLAASGGIPWEATDAVVLAAWRSRATGILLFAPLFLAWTPAPRPVPALAGWTEGVALVASAALMGALIFTVRFPSEHSEHALASVMVVLVLWAAFRFGLRASTLAAVWLAGLTGWAASRGLGPLVSLGDTDPVFATLHVQAFAWAVGLSSLLPAAALRQICEGTRALVVAGERLQVETEQRQRAELALETNRQRLALVMQSSVDGVWDWDVQAGTLYLSAQWKRQLGYADEELPDGLATLQGNLHPEDRDRVLGELWRFVEAPQGVWQAEFRMRHKDGSDRWVLARATPMLGPDGRATRLLGIHIDLTQRVAAESRLRELGEYNRLLLESAGDGIFGVDAEGCCRFVNEAALTMLGHPREALIGRHIHDVIHHSRPDGSPYPIEDCPMHRSYTERRGFHVATEVLWRGDGTSFPAEYSAFPVQHDGHLSGSVVVFRNITEARALARQMKYLATHDALTGLPNRRDFEHCLSRAIQSARDGNLQHVLCYLDLDQFKLVNDTCGHVAGDQLLRQLGDLLAGQVRRGDTLGRLGGDEFGVLLERCGLVDAMRIAETLRRTVQDFRFVWEGKTFAVGVSIGMVPISATTPSLATALAAADNACYVAKEAGRNRIHVCQPDDQETARRYGEMQWVSRLHDALAEDRFMLRRQPIVPLRSNTTGECFEFLLALREHDGRELPPGAFLPAAERYNLMPAIDRWVVRHALEWLTRSPARLANVSFCTLNLSGTTLGDDEFAAFVQAALRELNVDPRKICFEVTETAAIANLSRAVQLMGRLREHGCSFALDDFGSGMSSFGYLKNLPVDYLKIDGSFVRDVVVDEVDRAMVEAINRVGHVMRLQTIAEHVEGAEHLDAVRRLGVDFAQGFALGVPRPVFAA